MLCIELKKMVETVLKAADPAELSNVQPLAKDFIETPERLVFAVVENGQEQGKVLCFLRYIFQNTGWKKVNTDQSNQYLTDNHPHYLYFSPNKQAHCHAVELGQIAKHHQPKVQLKKILDSDATDEVEKDLQLLCQGFAKQGFDLDEIGVTGSILISAQNNQSDIDLVFYSRISFNKAREVIKRLIKEGICSELSNSDWLDSYDRRSCDLTFDEYVWHEKRKFNKALINHRKFDLSFVSQDKQCSSVSYKKLHFVKLQVEVSEDFLGFDYPAEFAINHAEIQSIVCYTATYTGQAFKGEQIEVAGQLEVSSEGIQRIVVGSSREATGEYIKVSNV